MPDFQEVIYKGNSLAGIPTHYFNLKEEHLNIKFTTKPNMLILIVSVVVLITVFLPWWSVSYLGFSASTNGFHSGGILTFLAALAGIALAFLDIPNARYRVLAVGGVGILALLGVIIAFTAYGGSSMGWGRIIALIASLALIVVGFLEGRKINMFKTAGTQPPASPPPAPPAK